MTWIEQSTRKNLLITKYLFTQQIVLELGLLNYFDAWSLEPTPFFQSFRWWHWLGKFGRWLFIYSSLSESCCFFFLSPPQKRSKEYMSQLSPKKRCRKSFPSKKLLLSPSTPWEWGPLTIYHRDRDDWVLWRVGPVSHDLPPERRLQPQRGESFRGGERTIVKGSAASWGIKIQTLIFRRGWSMMLDSMFHKQRGRLGEICFSTQTQPFPIGPWLPRILEVQVETDRKSVV